MTPLRKAATVGLIAGGTLCGEWLTTVDARDQSGECVDPTRCALGNLTGSAYVSGTTVGIEAEANGLQSIIPEVTVNAVFQETVFMPGSAEESLFVEWITGCSSDGRGWASTGGPCPQNSSDLIQRYTFSQDGRVDVSLRIAAGASPTGDAVAEARMTGWGVGTLGNHALGVTSSDGDFGVHAPEPSTLLEVLIGAALLAVSRLFLRRARCQK